MLFGLGFSDPTTAEDNSLLRNDWETTDWIQLGIVLPAPSRHCEEEDDQPPCYRAKQPPIIMRAEIGRIRGEILQGNLASGSMGLDWIGREHIRLGIAGFGAHFPGPFANGEWGFLIQPLSLYMGSNSWGMTNTNLHLRHNWPHFFIETGIDFSVYWITSPLGNEKPWGHGIEGFPLFLYISTGI
jgi:hypothetical protein